MWGIVLVVLGLIGIGIALALGSGGSAVVVGRGTAPSGTVSPGQRIYYTGAGRERAPDSANVAGAA